jgi:hypothetical protein
MEPTNIPAKIRSIRLVFCHLKTMDFKILIKIYMI